MLGGAALGSAPVSASAVGDSPPAAPEAAATPKDEKPWIVGLGDSYMSGEGATRSNKNFANNDRSTWSFHTTGDIDEVYGDKDGHEEIPYAHRSYSAPMHVGPDWNSKNLAVSGATLDTGWSEGGRFKPGIDFAKGGQAEELRDFAKTHDVKAVAFSIGGNDFGFSDYAGACGKSYFLGWPTPGKDSDIGKRLDSEPNYNKVTDHVRQATMNINKAMTDAGKQPGSWKIIYQMPPQIVPTAKKTKVSEHGWSRQDYYGLPVKDEDLDYIDATILLHLDGAMRTGFAQATLAMPDVPAVAIDNTRSFEGHKVGESSVPDYFNYHDERGMHPEWQDNNGRKTEWVTTFDYGDYKGKDWHKKQNPFHPNYWGQRALAANLEMALNGPAGTIIRPMPDAEGKTQELDSLGRPKMKNSATFPLWENDEADREPPNTISLTLVNNKSYDVYFGTTLVNPGKSLTVTNDARWGNTSFAIRDGYYQMIPYKDLSFDVSKPKGPWPVELYCPATRYKIAEESAYMNQGCGLFDATYVGQWKLVRGLNASPRHACFTLTVA
jgi:hypothetical protein